MKMRLSMIGLFEADPTIFDDMEIPSNNFTLDYDDLYIEPLPFDKEVFVFSLLSELSNFEVIYAQPEFMKKAITAWSKKRVWTWQKMYESFFYKYNPLWNKDGRITETETRNLEGNESGENVKTLNTQSTENSTSNATATDKRSVNAYNGGLTEAERNEHTGANTESNTGSDTGTISDDNILNRSESEEITRDKFERGNIGVTMSQQMIEADRALYLNNIYDIMISDFKNEFCILVY